MEAVIKNKHYCGSEKCVYTAYKNELPEGFIKEFLDHITPQMRCIFYAHMMTSVKKEKFRDIIPAEWHLKCAT